MTRAKKIMEATTDPLDTMLARLQLSGIRDQLDSLLDEAARASLSARETLILLCEREIARKDHRRIEMALKLAHFPAVKELAGFDFEAQPSIDPKQKQNGERGCHRRPLCGRQRRGLRNKVRGPTLSRRTACADGEVRSLAE